MSGAPPRRVLLVVVAAIATAAVLTRFWRLGWGLSDGMAFGDEMLLWPSYFRAFVPLRPESFLRPDVPAALLYPSLYGNLSGLAVWVAHELGWIVNPAAETFRAIYLARLISASAGVVNVGLVGLLGWRSYGPWVGLVASALMAVVPLEALQTHYVSVDVLLGVGTTLGLLAACELARRGSGWLALGAGAASGIAFSAKYTGLVLLASCGWALLERCSAGRSLRPLLALGPLVIVGFLLGVALGCPPCVLQSHFMFRAIRGLSHISSIGHLAFWNVHLVPSLGWYGRPYLYQLVAALPFSLGWPLYLAAIAGTLAAALRRDVVDRILIVTLLVYFVPIGMSFVIDAPRYFIPMLPGLLVLAARWLVGPGEPRPARLAIVGLVCAYTLALTLTQVARFSWEHQEGVARVVRAEFPPRGGDADRVAVVYPEAMQGYFGLRRPLLRSGLAPRPMHVERWLEERPAVIVVPEWFAIRARRDQPDGATARILERLESGDAGYREAARFASTYLQSRFYTWLDPAFASDLAQGEIGFRVYVRESA